MPDKIQSVKVVCQGGLNSNENSLDLSDNSPGSASRLINYEPSLFGGYRRINGYQKFDPNYSLVGGTGGEGKVLCITGFKSSLTGLFQTIAIRKDAGSNSYSIYYFLSGTGWQKFPNVPNRPMTSSGRTVTKVRTARFNFGDGNKIVFVDGVNNALLYDGTTWTTLKLTPGTGEKGGPLVLEAPSVVEAFENHLFLGGDPNKLALIAHSAPNDAGTWTAAAGAGQLTLGVELVNFKPFRENLFIFAENAIKKVAVTNFSEGPQFTLQGVTTNVGCVAKDSVVEIAGDLLFLAPDGFRPVAGTSKIGDVELETVSKDIQQLVRQYNEDYDLSTVNAVVIRTKSQVRFFYGADDVNNTESQGIIGGLRLKDGQVKWEFGETLGIRASCVFSEYVDGDELVLHGDYDGRVYRQEVGNNFDGQDIFAIYSTPYLDLGDTEVRKTFRRVNTFVRVEGYLELNLSSKYDWGNVEAAKPISNFEIISNAPTVYGGPNITYGAPNLKYGTGSKPYVETNIEGSGFSIRLTYVTVGQFAPYSIQGFVLEMTPGGMK